MTIAALRVAPLCTHRIRHHSRVPLAGVPSWRPLSAAARRPRIPPPPPIRTVTPASSASPQTSSVAVGSGDDELGRRAPGACGNAPQPLSQEAGPHVWGPERPLSRPRPGTAAAPQPSGPLTVTKTPLTPGPAKIPRGGQVCGLDGLGSRLGAGTRSPISAWWRRAHSGIGGYGDVLCSISVCPAFCAVWLGVA